MKILKIIMLSTVTFGLLSCKQDVPEKLQDFTTEDAQWFNYAVGDTFVFQNQTGDSLKIFVFKQEKKRIEGKVGISGSETIDFIMETYFETLDVDFKKMMLDSGFNDMHFSPLLIYWKFISGSSVSHIINNFGFCASGYSIVTSQPILKDTNMNGINFKNVQIIKPYIGNPKFDSPQNRYHVFDKSLLMGSFSDLKNMWVPKKIIKKK